uniref:Uncharacterized protein n=1 Tax=Picea glauca TaxID=3330 RepID=A0A101M3E3_PICGL|nr:hypothetical protein ABT39_MTgene3386 [Picea glauca]QHR89544.1 hypothetical protein Q903MT_gene3566 [Picea sitchensis]
MVHMYFALNKHLELELLKKDEMPLLTRRMLVPLPSLLLLPRGKVTRTLAEMLRGLN